LREKNNLTNSRPIPLEAPWTKETPLASEDDDEEEEKALLASDRSRGEREAMKVLCVGGGNSDSNSESYERGKNMKRGKTVTKKQRQKYVNCCY